MVRIDWSSAGLTYIESEGFWTQAWEHKSAEQQAEETRWAWDQWVIASCVERNGGHSWWLDWDEEEGLWLHCVHCPAGVDELYPDGQDLIFGELPGPHGKTVKIDGGSVDLAAPVQKWHGPVRAWVHEEYHRGGPWGGPEWDAWVCVEAA
jgi:hypothetical protein